MCWEAAANVVSAGETPDLRENTGNSIEIGRWAALNPSIRKALRVKFPTRETDKFEREQGMLFEATGTALAAQ